MRLLRGHAVIVKVCIERDKKGRESCHRTGASMIVSRFDFLLPTLQDWWAHLGFLSGLGKLVSGKVFRVVIVIFSHLELPSKSRARFCHKDFPLRIYTFRSRGDPSD